MKRFLLTLSLLLGIKSLANVHYIKYEKIPNYTELTHIISTLIDYNDYFINDSHVEGGEVRNFFIEIFENGINQALSLDTFNAETNLLLADIGILLLTLKQWKYEFFIIKSLHRAQTFGADAFRVNWAYSNYYQVKTDFKKAFVYAYLARKFFDYSLQKIPVEFWQDYIKICAKNRVWANCQLAINQIKKGGFSLSNEEIILENSINKILFTLNPSQKINIKTLWAAQIQPDKKNLFFSRAIGLKFTIDSNWKIVLKDLDSFMAEVILFPIFKKAPNKQYYYSITIDINVLENKKIFSLDNIKNTNYLNTVNYYLPWKIDEYYAFEPILQKLNVPFFEKEFYILLKRNPPSFPSLDIENPYQSSSIKINSFFNPFSNLKRFNNSIFYKIVLNCPAKDYNEILPKFRDFVLNNLLIE